MRSIMLDKIYVNLILGQMVNHACAIDIEKNSIGYDSRAKALEKYEDALDAITDMLEAYQDLLEHDIAQIKETVGEFEKKDLFLSGLWAK